MDIFTVFFLLKRYLEKYYMPQNLTIDKTKLDIYLVHDNDSTKNIVISFDSKLNMFIVIFGKENIKKVAVSTDEETILKYVSIYNTIEEVIENILLFNNVNVIKHQYCLN